MCLKAACLFDHGRPCGAESNGAKLLAAEAGFEACDIAVQTHGGYGYAKEFHVERLWREIRLYKIAPVSQQMVLNYLAEDVLGLPRSYGRLPDRVAAIDEEDLARDEVRGVGREVDHRRCDVAHLTESAPRVGPGQLPLAALPIARLSRLHRHGIVERVVEGGDDVSGRDGVDVDPVRSQLDGQR